MHLTTVGWQIFFSVSSASLYAKPRCLLAAACLSIQTWEWLFHLPARKQIGVFHNRFIEELPATAWAPETIIIHKHSFNKMLQISGAEPQETQREMLEKIYCWLDRLTFLFRKWTLNNKLCPGWREQMRWGDAGCLIGDLFGAQLPQQLLVLPLWLGVGVFQCRLLI